MNRVREPFNVNAMAQAAAMAALQDEDHIEKSRKMVAKARGQLAEGFSKLNIKAIPDQANFCFVDLGVDSRKAFTALMKKGVIVRTGDIFGFPTYIRVTYGTEKQNERLLKALGEVLDEL
jgi:histidinol-phosphate aminotransferase